MNPENEPAFHTEWIERYLSGELQGTELEQFLHRLQTDPGFEREVTVQRSIIEGAQRAGREELRRQLKGIHRQMGLTTPNADVNASKGAKGQSFPFFRYAVAAAVLVLLLVTMVWYVRRPPAVIAQASTTAVTDQAKVATIRYRVTGEEPAIGFSGARSDSTTTILLYAKGITAGKPGDTLAYRFDDTLRLYGHFTPSQLTLHYDARKEQYELSIDSVRYSLQRYQPTQLLK